MSRVCPKCRAVNTIELDFRLSPLPLGSYSIAGAQTKLVTRETAVASCRACGFSVTGRLENAQLSPDGVFTSGHFVADRAPAGDTA